VRFFKRGAEGSAAARKPLLRKGLPVLLEARARLKLNLPRIRQGSDIALSSLRKENRPDCYLCFHSGEAIHKSAPRDLPARLSFPKVTHGDGAIEEYEGGEVSVAEA